MLFTSKIFHTSDGENYVVKKSHNLSAQSVYFSGVLESCLSACELQKALALVQFCVEIKRGGPLYLCSLYLSLGCGTVLERLGGRYSALTLRSLCYHNVLVHFTGLVGTKF